MVTIHKQTREAIDSARKMVLASLDVAEVPDGHPVEKKVTAAFIDLEEAFDQLPLAGRNASALNDEGPVVRVIAGRDIRQWPTTVGKTALDAVIPSGGRTASRLASSPGVLLASKRFSHRRMLSSKEYLRALEDAEPVETSPFASSESYSMVSLAGT